MSHPDIQQVVQQVSRGQDLSIVEMAETINLIMQGDCEASDIAGFLLALRKKGETVDEVAGAAQAMRSQMQTIQSSRNDLLDTCGTGGDGSNTFNVSTAAAIVTAAAGVPVAKHGNRSISSKSGSADVLLELGVNVNASLKTVENCLDQLGICFCFAPLAHPAMKHVAVVRKELGVPTIFNILGPLCNPAGAPFQLLGVGRPALRSLMANALQKLGTQRAIVVCGEDGLDEVTLTGNTLVTEVSGSQTRELKWSPQVFNLEMASTQTMTVDGPEASAKMIRHVLLGNPGPARDIVVLNAAAALWVVGRSDETTECARLAAEAIDNGQANDLLTRLAEMSHRE